MQPFSCVFSSPNLSSPDVTLWQQCWYYWRSRENPFLKFPFQPGAYSWISSANDTHMISERNLLNTVHSYWVIALEAKEKIVIILCDLFLISDEFPQESVWQMLIKGSLTTAHTETSNGSVKLQHYAGVRATRHSHPSRKINLMLFELLLSGICIEQGKKNSWERT